MYFRLTAINRLKFVEIYSIIYVLMGNEEITMAFRADGKRVKNENIKIEIKANSNQNIEFEFTTVARLEKRPNKLNALKCGSLVFALPIEYTSKTFEYEKDGVERKFPYCDYELYPKSKWQYAFCSKRFALKENKVSKTPFSSKKPAVTIEAYVKEIDWGY